MTDVKRTLLQRLSAAALNWDGGPQSRCLRLPQKITWTLSALGWQFPEGVRICYVYWRTGNEYQGPMLFPWKRRS